MFSVPVGDDYQPIDPLNQMMRAYNTAKNQMQQQANQKEARESAKTEQAFKLGEMAAHAKLYNAQSDEAQANIANIPTVNALKALNIDAQFAKIKNEQGGYNSKFSQLTRFMSTPEGSKAVATNRDMAKDILQMANNAAYEGANPETGVNVDSQRSQLQSIASPSANSEDKPISGINLKQNNALGLQYKPNDDGSGYVDQKGNPVSVNNLSPQQKTAINMVTNAQIDAFQEASEDTHQKQTNTANTINQRKAVTSLVNTMEEAKNYLPGYLNFIGAAKKANVLVTKFANSAGKNDPNFNDYNAMVTTIFPTMNGEYRKMQAGNASDQETKFIEDIINPNTWWANPDNAIAKMNSVYKTTQKFARSLKNTQSETQAQLEQISNSNPEFFVNPSKQGLTINPAQLQQASPGAAQQLGMKTSARVLPIPEFKSKQEAIDFIAKQPPAIREHLRRQIARGS